MKPMKPAILLLALLLSGPAYADAAGAAIGAGAGMVLGGPPGAIIGAFIGGVFGQPPPVWCWTEWHGNHWVRYCRPRR